MIKTIDIYATYHWECPVCDASHTVESRNLIMVTCRKCGRDFEVDSYIGEVI